MYIYSLILLVTCRSKGYAFIEFKHRSDAEDAQDVSLVWIFCNESMASLYILCVVKELLTSFRNFLH